jgi:hypothetical protein
MNLAVGRHVFATGRFPDPDPWLFSLPDYHRRAIDLAYWGMHLGSAKLHALGGFALLGVVKALLVTGAAAAPLWLAHRLGLRSFLVPAIVLLGLWTANDRFIERGSLVSDCLGPVVLALLVHEMHRPGRRRWLIPVVLVVWTNIHPGVLTGLVFVALAALAGWRDWRRWLPLVAACAAATLVHPGGPRGTTWSVHLMSAIQPGGGSQAFGQHIVEWLPTLSAANIGTQQVQLLFLLCATTWALAVWALRRRRRPVFELATLAALTYLGFSMIRFVTTAALAMPLVAVALVARLRDADEARAPRPAAPSRPGVVALAATALVALLLDAHVAASGYDTPAGRRHLGFGLERRVYPFGAADFVASLPLVGGIFNEHCYGAFLAWHWNGRPKIFFHGYVLDEKFYERDFYAANVSEADFDRIVSKYDIGAFFLARVPLTPTEGPLLHRLLVRRPEWRLVFWDDRAVVFVRDRPEHRTLLATHELHWFNPFVRGRLDEGLRQAPAEVLEEVTRVLRWAPDAAPARWVARDLLRRDPDELARGPAAAR